MQLNSLLFVAFTRKHLLLFLILKCYLIQNSVFMNIFMYITLYSFLLLLFQVENEVGSAPLYFQPKLNNL